MCDEKRMDEIKERNRQAQQQENREAGAASDEEFAEKLYEENPPVPPQFQEEHSVSYTGSELKE